MKQESQDWLVALAEVLEANANPEQAKAMAAYMKDLFPFLGLKKPERTALCKPWLERGNRPAREDLPEVCFQLFQRPEREWAYVAIELLRLERKTLEYNDLEWLMELVRTRSWWDTVDILASDMVGRTLLRHPERWEEFLVPLMESENGWENRTAMIAQLRWKKETHTELLEQALVAHLESKWFFHRKAVGWALREYRKTDPHWVADFVDRHGEHMSGLSRREALR